MKKSGKDTFLHHLKIASVTGILLFAISLAVYITGHHTFGFMNLTGLITDRNRFILWTVNLFVLFIIAGELVDFLIRRILSKKQKNLIDAMQKVTDGEFNVRIESSTRLTDTGPVATSTFNDMASRLQENHVLHKEFMGIFSHEIKTPISTINGFARVLRDSSLSEEDKNEYINIIITETERLSTLSNNILLLSRIEKQTSEISKESYNLTEQLRQIIAVTYSEISRKGLDISLPEEDVSIPANQELMAHVWTNILSNAVKFSPENEKIYIDVTKNADCISVSIKNYGCTLRPSECARIFEKFYRGEASSNTVGNGIGLSVVKKIVSLHNGECTASVTDDGEFTITVSLPY